MKTVAIVLAAGSGSRMKTETRKQFLRIGDKPILFYSLEKIEKCSFIQEVILVTHQNDLLYVAEAVVDQYQFTKAKKIVPGGEERQDSVYSGLKAIDGAPDLVVIHDSARPFFALDLLEEGLKMCVHRKALIFASPITSTVKSAAHKKVTKTLDRTNLWEVQTPQIFDYKLINSAYEEAIRAGIKATDDAMMVEYLEKDVHILESDKRNIKITTPDDLDYANYLFRGKHI